MASTEENLGLIEKALIKLKKFTINDIAAHSGLSAFDSKRGVEDLMKKYTCRILVTDQGELVYDFGNIHRRGSKTFGEYLADFTKLMWKVFTYIFKVWIMVMLVGYFVAFVALLIGIAIASAKGDKKGKSSSGAFSLLLRVFAEFFYWKTVTGNIGYNRDRYGYRYRQYETVQSGVFKQNPDKPKKKFVTAVFDFVFGPKRAEINPLENQLEVATFLREQKGIITVPEVRALAGWKGSKADDFFTESVSNYEGDIKVSDNGIVYGDFLNFLSGKSKEQSTQVVYYWDEFEPEYKLNGNSVGSNILIVIMSLLVFFMSMGVLGGGFDEFLNFIPNYLVYFGLIPFVYSFLFFAIPIVRIFVNIGLNSKRRKNNIRKRLIKEIFSFKDSRVPVTTLEQSLNSSNEISDKVDSSTIKKIMDDEIYDWQGEMAVDDNANVVYDFSLLKNTQAEAQLLRSQRKVTVSTGETVFDSGMS
jgi:hypothetical protein